MGTNLYDQVMQMDTATDLLKQLWRPFPFMVEAFTGRGDHSFIRMQEITDWLHDNFGQEGNPLRGIEGAWRVGGATVNGWTWVGFTEEDAMQAFIERWDDDEAEANRCPAQERTEHE